jgi:tetratricopeptide (TPR) repeat protein
MGAVRRLGQFCAVKKSKYNPPYMRAFTFYSSPRADRGFNLGLALVILFAAAEALSLSVYYVGRIRANHPAARLKVTAVTAPRVTPAPLPTVKPLAAPALALSSSTSALSAADRLLKEATELGERGDTINALARLQEASEKDPKNAQVLAEMATIYESIQNFDRSNETWRRVQEIGPSAGPLYELADAKLKTGSAVGTSSDPGLAEVSPLDAGMSRSATGGIPDGSVLGISEVTTTETPDPDADTNLMLRIGVKKRANAVIDHTKVKIQVFFYDSVDNKDIKLTDAEVNYEWLTPNHDWAGADPELLAVTYVRPKSKAPSSEAALTAAAAAVNPAKKGRPAKANASLEAGQREYLGYIVRVYYNDQLQDKRAEPTKLLNLFPPPFTAPSQ